MSFDHLFAGVGSGVLALIYAGYAYAAESWRSSLPLGTLVLFSGIQPAET